MKSIIQKISYQIRPFPRTQKRTGKNAFGLQIVINGDPRLIAIEVSWYISAFDINSETFRHDANNAETVRDLNLIIAKEKSRANDIITRYRLTNRSLSHKNFRWEFSSYASRENVHEYLAAQTEKLFTGGEIKAHTYHNYLSTIARLKNYHPDPLPFTSINAGFMLRFDNHLRIKDAYQHNTVVGTHKTLKKLFRLSVMDGLLIEMPYNEKIATNYIEGNRESLTPDELKLLIGLFNVKSQLSPQALNVLEMFVFSATSGGYRFSELEILHSENIKFGKLKMNTVKGFSQGKALDIILPEIGLEIIKGRKGKIFPKIAEPTANKKLKDLASMAGIQKHITFHSARDTFGTLYVYMGGDITTLSKDIFKHSSLDTTMIYQKKSTDMKRKDMENFNSFKLP